MQLKKTVSALLAGGLVLSMAACTTTSDDAATQKKVKEEIVIVAADLNNDDLYEVFAEDGRLYVFDDRGLYLEFIEMGETPYRQTFIGSGPDGQTLVFGVTGKDKKKLVNDVASYNMYMGTLAEAEDFYGEMRLDGRIYVFDNLNDMKAVRESGEAAYRYTDIGAGPNGETVVYVLNKNNKKKKPEALIAEFKKHNSEK